MVVSGAVASTLTLRVSALERCPATSAAWTDSVWLPSARLGAENVPAVQSTAGASSREQSTWATPLVASVAVKRQVGVVPGPIVSPAGPGLNFTEGGGLSTVRICEALAAAPKRSVAMNVNVCAPSLAVVLSQAKPGACAAEATGAPSMSNSCVMASASGSVAVPASVTVPVTTPLVVAVTPG